MQLISLQPWLKPPPVSALATSTHLSCYHPTSLLLSWDTERCPRCRMDTPLFLLLGTMKQCLFRPTGFTSGLYDSHSQMYPIRASLCPLPHVKPLPPPPWPRWSCSAFGGNAQEPNPAAELTKKAAHICCLLCSFAQ